MFDTKRVILQVNVRCEELQLLRCI